MFVQRGSFSCFCVIRHRKPGATSGNPCFKPVARVDVVCVSCLPASVLNKKAYHPPACVWPPVSSRSYWPSAQLCKACSSGFSAEKDQPTWSETEVLKFLTTTYSCPDDVGEGADSPGTSWTVTCVLVCAVVSLMMWARRRQEMRGVGLTKKFVDTVPSS